MMANRFERFAAVCAILAGVAGFLYAVAFIVLQNALLSGLFLLLGGFLTSAALVAVYGRLRETEGLFALWALVLGLLGAAGTAIHGGYDLATVLNPAAGAPAGLPNAVDPRGLLTFGVAGAGMLVVAWLIVQGRALPKGLGYLGALLAALMLILYLGRLIILDARHPIIVVPALITGFVVNPAWFIWLGLVLRRAQQAGPAPSAMRPAAGD